MLYQLSYIGAKTGCRHSAIGFGSLIVHDSASQIRIPILLRSEGQQKHCKANLRSQDVPDNQNRKDFRRCVPLVQVYFLCAADKLELAKGFEPPTL